MPQPIRRITVYREDAPQLAGSRAAIEALKMSGLLSVDTQGRIAVVPNAITEGLADDQREVVYRLLGYQVPLADTPLIVKRAGILGGRAMVAGTRTPVWRVVSAFRRGLEAEEVRRQTGLSDVQISQAMAYADRQGEEIAQDLLDNELSELLWGAGAR